MRPPVVANSLRTVVMLYIGSWYCIILRQITFSMYAVAWMIKIINKGIIKYLWKKYLNPVNSKHIATNRSNDITKIKNAEISLKTIEIGLMYLCA